MGQEWVNVELFDNGVTMSLSDTTGYLTKSPVPEMGYLFLSCWPVSLISSLRHYWILSVFLVSLQNFTVGLSYWRHHILGLQNMEKSRGCWPRGFISAGSLPQDEKMLCTIPGNIGNHHSHPLVNLVSNYNGWPHKLCLLRQWWHGWKLGNVM